MATFNLDMNRQEELMKTVEFIIPKYKKLAIPKRCYNSLTYTGFAANYTAIKE